MSKRYRPLKNIARRLESQERPSARGQGRAAARRGPISARYRHHYLWPEHIPQQELIEALSKAIHTRHDWQDRSSFGGAVSTSWWDQNGLTDSISQRSVILLHQKSLDVIEVNGLSARTVVQNEYETFPSYGDLAFLPILSKDKDGVYVLEQGGIKKYDLGFSHNLAFQNMETQDTYALIDITYDGSPVTRHGKTAVTRYDPDTLEVVAENTESVQEWNPAIAPRRSGDIVVTHASGIYRLDGDSLDTLDSAGSVGGNWLAKCGGDGYIYCNNANNDGLVQIDPDQLVRTNEWAGSDGWLNSILWGQDGYIWASNGHNWGNGTIPHEIYKINPETFKLEGKTQIQRDSETDNFHEFLTWTLDGYVLNAHCTDGVLYLLFVDPDTVEVVDTQQYATGTAISGLTAFFGQSPMNADRFVTETKWQGTLDLLAPKEHSARWRWGTVNEMIGYSEQRRHWEWGTENELVVYAEQDVNWLWKAETELSEP